MEWDAIKPELDRKLDPAHVKPPSKFGPKGDYIEGWHAIAEANRIFGHGAWSYTIKTLSQDSLKEGKNGKGDMQWQAAYTCIVTLTVGDVTREDVGFGSGFSKQIGDAIEGATKEAVTDALKRALRTFGNPFGLALYDKSRANVGVDPEPFNAAEMRDRLKAAIGKAANATALEALWTHPKTCEAFDQLPPPMQGELQKAYTDRIGAVYQAPPEAAE
jgi:DNA recombination protein Rad52